MIEEKNTYREESGDLAEKMMGSFLARVLHLENLMNNIMTQHFCSADAERAALFLSSITPDMSFRNRINIFINMVIIYYDEIYKTHDSDLRKLYELDKYRNDLVNLVIFDSEQVLNKNDTDTVQSLKSVNRKSTMGEATRKEHETKVLLCIKLAAILNTIQREITLSKLS
jgi:hypothetical protein